MNKHQVQFANAVNGPVKMHAYPHGTFPFTRFLLLYCSVFVMKSKTLKFMAYLQKLILDLQSCLMVNIYIVHYLRQTFPFELNCVEKILQGLKE